MAEIVRLSFPEYVGFRFGIPCRGEFMGFSIIPSLLEKYRAFTRILQEGVYNLTPEVWDNNKARHELVVLRAGQALYRMLTRSHDTAVVDFDVSPGIVLRGITPGGRTIQIPEEGRNIIVTGGSRFHPGEIRLYEVIVCVDQPTAAIPLQAPICQSTLL